MEGINQVWSFIATYNMIHDGEWKMLVVHFVYLDFDGLREVFI